MIEKFRVQLKSLSLGDVLGRRRHSRPAERHGREAVNRRCRRVDGPQGGNLPHEDQRPAEDAKRTGRRDDSQVGRDR
jgi:hypothetical protein